MQFLPIGIYLVLCSMLAYAGRKTRIGAFGVFLCSVIFTPLVVGLIFALLRPMPKQVTSGKAAEP